jgi:hypothetical protein
MQQRLDGSRSSTPSANDKHNLQQRPIDDHDKAEDEDNGLQLCAIHSQLTAGEIVNESLFK